MPRFVFWIGAIFALVGSGMGVGTYYAWSSMNELASEGIRTQGTVIDLEYRRDDEGSGTYAPVVEFYDEQGRRQVYYSSSSSNPPAYDRGEKVDLFYKQGTPERAMIDSFSDRWLLPMILGLFTVVFGGVGYGLLFVMVRRWRTIGWLKANGVAIEAEFERCYRDTSTKVNGRSPWRVEASGVHPTTGEVETYQSEQIWTNLARQLEGKSVRVLVDPDNIDDHYIDLSEYLKGRK